MRQQLTKMSSMTNIIVILAVVALIYFLVKRSGSVGNYKNTKTWHIKYDANGMPVEITKFVDANIR